MSYEGVKGVPHWGSWSPYPNLLRTTEILGKIFIFEGKESSWMKYILIDYEVILEQYFILAIQVNSFSCEF